MTAVLDRMLTLDVVRVTEAAAIAASAFCGRGNEKEADRAAVDAMRTELNRMDISGRIVIGEGERDEAPMLFIGEEVGNGHGTAVDIAVDPLEGTTICAKAAPNSMAVLAMAPRGTMLHAPDVYMDKIAIGPGHAPDVIDLDASPTDNLHSFAASKGVKPEELSVCILDRARHAALIEEVRKVGAGVKLIGDGDIQGVIQTTDPDETGVDMYMGIGGAPEGVLAAAALRCVGGQIQTRLVEQKPGDRERAAKIGVEDFDRKYTRDDMVQGDAIFSATGVTDGTMLSGVKTVRGWSEVETIVMRAATGTVRTVRARRRPRSGT